jgi:predicted amidohydrolase/GNAT superfamily N-acetyltransferase
MKICIAQTKSENGKIQENIKNHLELIERAIKLNSDLIIFPELSITNYEPKLANELATSLEDSIFNSFQDVSDKNQIAIGIGMPTKSSNGINISMLIFQPKKEKYIYSKQILHSDELPYFVCGNEQSMLYLKGKKIAIGICYETLQREHFTNAYQKGADLYIASVAKPRSGIEKAHKHFSEIATEFNIPILMSNCVGFCDNFMSEGRSAVWNNKGRIIGKLNDENQGLLFYDTKSELIEIDQLKIEKGDLSNLEKLFKIYLNGKQELERNSIYQWTNNYPTISIIESDLRKGVLYTLKNNDEILGAINISEEQEAEYESIQWEYNDSKALVIHRLVIDPIHQRKGYAQKLMDFAENFAKENDYTSIRLDAYSQNESVIEFYKKRGYFIRGNVNFPEREYSFHCMEKKITTVYNRV